MSRVVSNSQVSQTPTHCSSSPGRLPTCLKSAGFCIERPGCAGSSAQFNKCRHEFGDLETWMRNLSWLLILRDGLKNMAWIKKTWSYFQELEHHKVECICEELGLDFKVCLGHHLHLCQRARRHQLSRILSVVDTMQETYGCFQQFGSGFQERTEPEIQELERGQGWM